MTSGAGPAFHTVAKNVRWSPPSSCVTLMPPAGSARRSGRSAAGTTAGPEGRAGFARSGDTAAGPDPPAGGAAGPSTTVSATLALALSAGMPKRSR
ncbi:hypothetical protein [Dactylosporangium sp. NPDC049140]|uniref:hypothetical protein n=1 Tax=Dactylosporangium sp. NPDC049140 TaxID=3155647 RepID=UPI0033EFA1C2